MKSLTLLAAAALLALTPTSQAGPSQLQLPTANDAIFSSNPEDFYMYCDRSFEGVQSKPWTAGKYGFVRNMRRTAEGVIGTRFHEGIDIKPLKRDSNGVPLDIIHPIDSGKVVHVNAVSSRSNYGKYIVVEHRWPSGTYYSLYAHLNRIDCQVGQKVDHKSSLGTLGYTGVGINKTRAHLHLELCVMSSPRFETWYGRHYTSPNHHSIYSGLNLVGMDIAELYKLQRKHSQISIPDLVSRETIYYKITVPRKGQLDIVKRYPWLVRGNHRSASASWEISFTDSGFPLAVEPSSKKVGGPVVSYVRPSKTHHSYQTKKYLSGSGSSASVSSSGSRYIQLITGAF
ncbi:M23 family metallopeptidase [Persicirhabdus sediminis]|uniref:M23 family metallopeptidase n=1 Tax=Persicirhabdus sediminis TaxID=454144 RepID=A0A8J7SHH0_9BACT|nr:M23 family metallopeptidase [Persicirhabdus sediminis]MBK1789839.1 M23 family metallopeptidase [Persicirhabdus sediminis]